MAGIEASELPFHDREITAKLKALMIDHSLPLWAREGWDRSRGGFIERLTVEGAADHAAPRRVRVQARQVYSFAMAAQLGWFPQGKEIAMTGLDYMITKAKSPDGRPGFVHLIDRDGAVLNALRDTYDHAFVLLALATVYRLTGDAQVRQEIEALVEFLDADLRTAGGGFAEGIPASLPRRQNPQMHLLEALIATFDATGDPIYRKWAGDLFELFVASLYDERRRLLGEYFENDWTRIEPVCVEPGHHAEWVWLLRSFERISDRSTGRYCSQLLSSALRYSDDVTGCLLDEGDAEGGIRKSSRRLWPQTEIAKAWIAQAEADEPGAADQAIQALGRLHRHYLCHPVAGGWYDQFDRENRSLVNFIPASSFYHIICAVAEANRVLGE